MCLVAQHFNHAMCNFQTFMVLPGGSRMLMARNYIVTWKVDYGESLIMALLTALSATLVDA